MTVKEARRRLKELAGRRKQLETEAKDAEANIAGLRERRHRALRQTALGDPCPELDLIREDFLRAEQEQADRQETLAILADEVAKAEADLAEAEREELSQKARRLLRCIEAHRAELDAELVAVQKTWNKHADMLAELQSLTGLATYYEVKTAGQRFRFDPWGRMVGVPQVGEKSSYSVA